MVVAVVGFKWHRRGKRKTQIDEIETLSNHYLAETSDKKERTYKKQ